MKAPWRVAALLAVFLTPDAVRADMGMPGFKSRELRVVIDDLADHPEYLFFRVHPDWPTRTQQPTDFHPAPVSEFELRLKSGKYASIIKLLAVPRRLIGPRGEVDWEAVAKNAPGVLYSDPVQIRGLGDVAILWPVDYEVHHYRVDLADGKLFLTLASVEHGSDGFSSWIPGILTALAVTGIGVWIARRRIRSRRAGLPSP
jgi:hypothetical protein